MPSRATWCCSAPAGTTGGRPITSAVQPARRSRPTSNCKDNAEFGSGEPGVAPEVCDYLAEEDLDDRLRHLGPRALRLRQDGAPESFAYCHMNLVAAARHLQLREPRPRRSVRRQGLRVPVRVGTAQAGRRHRLTRQSGRGVLTRPSIGSGAGPRAGSFIHDVPGGAERGVAPSGVCRHTGGGGRIRAMSAGKSS